MSDPRSPFERVESIFLEACELAPDERAPFLDRACEGDAELRREVERLLESDASVGGGLTGAVARASDDLVRESAGLGVQVGPYRVLETVGQGGMGAVYRAVRDDDAFSKEVAIKVVAPGLAGPDVKRRFRDERQILANLDHPGIARLLDGGATEEGTPYLVMEFVEGVPIDRHCAARGASVEERLRLFREVCEAVHEAHRNLIVHRDLKPANILVGSDGRPKLLDFGIAKILDPAAAVPGRTATRLMTPEYASPEQVQGRAVTTASDVYALGVLLYELLSGERPYKIDAANPAEVLRLVCEVDPKPPSEAVRVGNGRTEGWRRTLAGDLDRIVAMAIHKEPARRYPSAAALADDVDRYLAGEPVVARDDTWTYRTGKFVRRHRLAVASSVAFVLLLGGFGVTMARQSARVTAERDLVALERAKAERVSEFVVGLFRTPDEGGLPGRDLPAHRLLASGLERLEDLEDQPALRAELLETIGDVYLMLDMVEEAEPLVEESLALRFEIGAPPVDLAESHTMLAKLRYIQGKFDDALDHYSTAFDLRIEELGPDATPTAWALHGMGSVYSYRGQHDLALDVFERAVEIVEAADPDAADLFQLRGSLGTCYQQLGRLEEAERELAALYRLAHETYGPGHVQTAEAAASLGTLLRRMEGREAEAEPYYREALEARREAFGVHSLTAQSMNNYAVYLRRMTRYDEARPLYHGALAMYREVHAEKHPDVGLSLTNVATFERDHGDVDVALAMYREALDVYATSMGTDYWIYSLVRCGLAQALVRAEDPVAAEREWREGLDGLTRAMGADHPRVRRQRADLADWLRSLGRENDAVAIEAEAGA